MDSTAFATVQRERWEDDPVDVVSNTLCLCQDCLFVWISPIYISFLILEIPFRLTWNFDTRVLRFDENRSGGRLCGFAKLRAKTLVPATPQR